VHIITIYIFNFTGASTSVIRVSLQCVVSNKLTLSLPGNFLVICSASFKKSPKIYFFSQLFEKNRTYELTPIGYGKKYTVLLS
jgi:hypothetical protein